MRTHRILFAAVIAAVALSAPSGSPGEESFIVHLKQKRAQYQEYYKNASDRLWTQESQQRKNQELINEARGHERLGSRELEIATDMRRLHGQIAQTKEDLQKWGAKVDEINLAIEDHRRKLIGPSAYEKEQAEREKDEQYERDRQEIEDDPDERADRTQIIDEIMTRRAAQRPPAPGCEGPRPNTINARQDAIEAVQRAAGGAAAAAGRPHLPSPGQTGAGRHGGPPPPAPAPLAAGGTAAAGGVEPFRIVLRMQR